MRLPSMVPSGSSRVAWRALGGMHMEETLRGPPPGDPNKDGQPDHLHVPGGQTLRPEFAQEVVALEEVAA